MCCEQEFSYGMWIENIIISVPMYVVAYTQYIIYVYTHCIVSTFTLANRRIFDDDIASRSFVNFVITTVYTPNTLNFRQQQLVKSERNQNQKIEWTRTQHAS